MTWIAPLPIAAAGLVVLAGTGWARWRYREAGGEGREAQLARAKRRAALFLVAAAGGFVATYAAPQAWVAHLLRTGFEAAMVGAIADWLAVSALFRRIPFVGESDLVARQKNAIGDDFAEFVRDKFLDADSLATLIRKHDLAQVVAGWLAEEANSRHLAGFLLKFVGGSLELLEADRVKQLLQHAARTALANVDLSRTAGEVLDTLTADGRHQELLDQLIARMLDATNRLETRQAIAEKIVSWLRTEHRTMHKVLPSEWIGDKGSEIIASNLGAYLEEIRDDPQHRLRASFDEQVHRLVERLRADPRMRDKADEIRNYLLDDEALGRYAGEIWSTFSGWMKRDLEAPDSVLHRNVVAAAAWLGRELAADPELRRTLNLQLEAAARTAAPEFAEFLTRHFRETVHHWDARQMSHQVELALGARLQKIRLNGTVMGFVIGIGLYGAHAAASRWLAP